LTAGIGQYPNGTFCNTSEVAFNLVSNATSDFFSDGSSYFPCVGHAFDTNVALGFSKLPGEVFPIEMHLAAGGRGGYGTIRGTLTFNGLPQGYTIQSCQGYAGQSVPTLPTSWGHIKHAYR
jgi:hypothetical protein